MRVKSFDVCVHFKHFISETIHLLLFPFYNKLSLRLIQSFHQKTENVITNQIPYTLRQKGTKVVTFQKVQLCTLVYPLSVHIGPLKVFVNANMQTGTWPSVVMLNYFLDKSKFLKR